MAMSDSNTRELEVLHAIEASGWVETMRRASPGDEMRFVAWLKESPRNVRDFLLMLSLDCALDRLDAGRLESIESLIAQVDERVTALPTRPALISRTRGRGRWKFAAAASVLLAAGAAAAWLTERRAGWQEIETSTGEQRTVELADGSVVYLNTHSRLRVRLSAHIRDVRLLRGEALFRVHHDAARPFLVYTDDAMVQAVGTQFDVYRRDDGTVVAVLEGRVNLTPAAGGGDASGGAAAPAGPRVAVGPGASRSLGASEEARVSHAGSVSIREVNNVSDTVAWRERRLIFHEQTLGQIVHEFNRYRTNPIRLEGVAVTERVYTGVFDADDADSLVQVLAHDPALSVERSGEAVVVKLR
jgi:transmembrane sensor